MPQIKNMKYKLGYGDWVIAEVAIPHKAFLEMDEMQVAQWLGKIMTTCPLYEGREKEVGNHAHATLIDPDYIEEPAF